MRTRLPADSLVGRAILSARIGPGAVIGLGLAASLVVPVLVELGGGLVLVSLLLVGVTALADASLSLLAARSSGLSRRVLVFEPLAARLSEGAWLLALWNLGAPGPAVVIAGALCWTYEQTRARARQVGLRDLGMVTLGERSVRMLAVGLGLAAAGVISFAGGDQFRAWVSGAVTVAAVAWLLMAALGLLQLVIVVSAALREE